jgi:uncharacterized protein YrrD
MSETARQHEHEEPAPPVRIKIGAEVHGQGEKLGEVSRVIVDADSDLITHIVVKHGFPGLATERIIPMTAIRSAAEGALVLHMGKDEFERADGFDPQNYRAPDPDYTGPPGFDVDSHGQANMALDAYVAMGAKAGIGQGSPVFGFPGGESQGPDFPARPDIGEGTDVLSAEGEKVGEVAEFEAAADTGQLKRLVVKQGWLFTSEREVPVDWVTSLSDKGVMLSASKRDVEALSTTD